MVKIGAIRENFEVSVKSNLLNKASFTEKGASYKGAE